MPQEPRVLRRLKALGLTQKTIAAYIGASPAAVSQWVTGKHPFVEPWRTEATALLALLAEHLAAGGTLATFSYHPTVAMGSSGVTFMGGPLEIPDTYLEDFVKMRSASSGLPPGRSIAMQGLWFAQLGSAQLAERLANVDILTAQFTAQDLDALRRSADTIRHFVLWALQEKARTALEESTDADQTP